MTDSRLLRRVEISDGRKDKHQGKEVEVTVFPPKEECEITDWEGGRKRVKTKAPRHTNIVRMGLLGPIR